MKFTNRENEFKTNERQIQRFHDSLMDSVLDAINERVSHELDNYSERFSLKMYKDIERTIGEFLDPLKIIIGEPSDKHLDFIETLGIVVGLKTLYDVFRITYRTQTSKPSYDTAWRKEALKWMKQNTSRHIDKYIADVSSNMLDEIKKTADEFQFQTAKEEIERKRSSLEVKKTLKEQMKKHNKKWKLIVATECAMAKGVASVQAIMDSGEENPTVAVIDMDDDIVSNFCKKHSRHKNGMIKYYKFLDLKPAGYNLGKDPKDWKNSIPPRHFNCRCWVVHVPKGYRLDINERLVKLKEDEEIVIEKVE